MTKGQHARYIDVVTSAPGGERSGQSCMYNIYYVNYVNNIIMTMFLQPSIRQVRCRRRQQSSFSSVVAPTRRVPVSRATSAAFPPGAAAGSRWQLLLLSAKAKMAHLYQNGDAVA